MTKVNKLSNEAAAAIWGQFGSDNPKVIKEAVSIRIEELLANGQISEKDARRALRVIENDDLINAIAGRNRTEHNYLKNALDEWNSLENEQADKLMKDSGLTPDDLFDVFPLAESDYTIQPKELARITDELNKKIQEKGGNKKLKKSEAKMLMSAIGLNVKKDPLSTLKRIFSFASPIFYLIPGVMVDGLGSAIVEKRAQDGNGDKVEKQMDTIAVKASETESHAINDDRTIDVLDNHYPHP